MAVAAIENPQPPKHFYGPESYTAGSGEPGVTFGDPVQAYNTTFTFQEHTYTFTNYSFVFNISYSPAYCYGDSKLNVSDLDTIATCIPRGKFVWSLSSLLVQIVLSMQVVWIFGVVVEGAKYAGSSGPPRICLVRSGRFWAPKPALTLMHS